MMQVYVKKLNAAKPRSTNFDFLFSHPSEAHSSPSGQGGSKVMSVFTKKILLRERLQNLPAQASQEQRNALEQEYAHICQLIDNLSL